MAEPNKSNEVGSGSPGSEEAQQQNASGTRGGAQGDRPSPETPDQPPQGTQRRSAQHEQDPTQRKSFPPGHAPSEQGEGTPSPESIKEHQQGMLGGRGQQSGSHSAHGERNEEVSQSGPPSDEHARHGRQDLPGDRGSK